MADRPERFAARWSRRKAADRTDDVVVPAETPHPAETAPCEPDMPAELPSIDDLTAESDFTPFLQKNVPAALKKAALAKLWRSDPILANLDGLNDYDLDFTNAGASGLVATAYQVGKGMAKRLAQDAAPDPATQDEAPDPDVVANQTDSDDNNEKT